MDDPLAELTLLAATMRHLEADDLPRSREAVHAKIIELREAGVPVAAICQASGYSDQRIFQIMRAHRDAVLDTAPKTV